MRVFSEGSSQMAPGTGFILRMARSRGWQSWCWLLAGRPQPPHHTGLSTALLEQVKQSKNQGWSKHRPWLKTGPLPVFINKLLLAHDHAHVLTRCLWLLLHCKCNALASGVVVTKITWLVTHEIFTVWLFTGKICLALQMTKAEAAMTFVT